jgi:hypothetical protein
VSVHTCSRVGPIDLGAYRYSTFALAFSSQSSEGSPELLELFPVNDWDARRKASVPIIPGTAWVGAGDNALLAVCEELDAPGCSSHSILLASQVHRSLSERYITGNFDK